MSDRQTERERDVATLATIREFMDVTKEYDNAQDGHSIRDGTRALLRIIDRLTAERDAAHEKIVSFGSTMADLIMLRSENTRLEAETIESAAILEKAVKESKAIVKGYNRAIDERDAARAECDQIRGWMTGYALLREQYAKEYLMRGELGKSDISTVIAQDIAAALNAFPLPDRAALGNESEASE